MKSKIIYIGLISCLLTAASCSKFLDKEPLSAGTDENFWKDETEGNSAVAGGYSLLRYALTDAMAYYGYGDFPTDEFRSGLGGDYGPISDITWNASIPYTSTWLPLMKLRRYDNWYRVIDQANRCLKFLPGIPLNKFSVPEEAEISRNKLLGEAYFLRAFSYFYMARVWGDVPVVLQSPDEISAAVNLPRTPEAEVLAQAKADVGKAIQLLTWGYTDNANKAVRANKGSAFALLAHLHAWMGNYADCAAAADSVLIKGGYQYVDRNAAYLSIYKGQSSEGIFEIAQNAINEGNSSSIAFFTLKYPYLATNTGTTAILPLDVTALALKFPDAADLRVQKAFAFFNSTDPNCIKYSNIIYTGQNQTAPIAQNNIIIFRLSDIALLKAEALAATSQFGDARTLLNLIMGFAKPGNSYTGTDNNLFEAIIDERGRELFLEGHRFYDLVRLGKVKGIYKFGGSRMNAADFLAGKWHWPVEPYLITLNQRLLQTNYWKDKM